MSDDITIGYGIDASGYAAGMAQIDQANQLANRSMLAVAASAVGLRQTLAQISPSNMKTLGGGQMVKEAAETQQALSGLSAMAETTKVSAGKLQGTMRDLARTFPIGTQGGREVVMQFTKMGVAAAGSEGQIAKLATSVVKLSGATGENMGELASGMTALSRATGNTALDPKRFQDMGDSLTTISAQSGASATSILAFSKNIAPMAQAAGIGTTGILGISSAFARLGEDGVGASTAVNKMLTDMNKAVQDGSPQMQSYAQILGQTTDQFKEMYKADPTRTLGALTTKIAQSGPSGIRDLESIGIEGIRGQRAFQALIGSGGLEEATRTATKAYGDDSTNRASEAAFGGFNDSLTELTATTRQLGDALGTPMLGILTRFTDGLKAGTGLLVKFAESEVGQKVAGGVGVISTLVGIVRTALPVLAMLGLGRMALTGGGLKSFFAGMAQGRGDVGLDRDTRLRRQGGRFNEQMVRNSAGITGLNRAGFAVGERFGEEAMYRQAFTEQRKRTEFYEKNRARYDAMQGFSPQDQRLKAMQEYTEQQRARAARRAMPLPDRIAGAYRTAVGYGSGAIQSYFGAGSEFKRQAAMRAEERGRIDMMPGFRDQMSQGRLAYGDARSAGRNMFGASTDALKAFHESVREAGKQTGHFKNNLRAVGESAAASGNLLKQLGKDAWGGTKGGFRGVKGALGGMDGALGALGMGGIAGAAGMGLMGLITGSIGDSQAYKERLKEFDNTSVTKLIDSYRESAGIATGPTTTFGAVAGNLGKNLVASATSAAGARRVTDADVTAAAGQKAVNQYYGTSEETVAQLQLAKPEGFTPREIQAIKQDLLVQKPNDRAGVESILSQLMEQATMPIEGNVGAQAYQAMAGMGKLPDAGWLRGLAPSLPGIAGRDILHFDKTSTQQSGLIDTTLGGIEGRYQQQKNDFGDDYGMQERLLGMDAALRGAAKNAEETGQKDQFQELSDKIARQLTHDTSITGMTLEQYQKAGGPSGGVEIGNEIASRATGDQQEAFAAAYKKLQDQQTAQGGQLDAIAQDSPLFKTIMGQSSVLAQSANTRLGTVDSKAFAAALANPLDATAMNTATNEMIDAAKRSGKSLSDVAVEAGNTAAALAAGTPAFAIFAAAAAKSDQRFQAGLVDMTPAEQAKAVREQGMAMAATPRTNEFGDARATQGQQMVQQQYAADRGRLVGILTRQRSYDIGKGRATQDYTTQRGYAEDDYDKTVARTREQFRISQEYAETDYLRNKKYAEDDYRTSTERAEDDFNTSRERQQRDFQINSERSQADYLTSRGRMLRDFNKTMTRQMEDAADGMYDPFKRIQTQATWDAQNLIVNLDEQAKAMRDQESELDKLRKMGLSDTAIESLGLTKSENAQQVSSLVADATNDPAVIAALSASAEGRRSAGQALYVDPNNKDLQRQREDFSTSLADMDADHLKAVTRNKEDYDKLKTDQVTDYRKQMGRVHDDFLKQMGRSETAYNTQVTRNEAALELSLTNMETDQGISLGRMDTAHNLALTRMAEDLKEANKTIAGDMKDLSAAVQKAMHGEAIDWQTLLVDDSQDFVDDLTNKVIPKYVAAAQTIGIDLRSKSSTSVGGRLLGVRGPELRAPSDLRVGRKRHTARRGRRDRRLLPARQGRQHPDQRHRRGVHAAGRHGQALRQGRHGGDPPAPGPQGGAGQLRRGRPDQPGARQARLPVGALPLRRLAPGTGLAGPHRHPGARTVVRHGRRRRLGHRRLRHARAPDELQRHLHDPRPPVQRERADRPADPAGPDHRPVRFHGKQHRPAPARGDAHQALAEVHRLRLHQGHGRRIRLGRDGRGSGLGCQADVRQGAVRRSRHEPRLHLRQDARRPDAPLRRVDQRGPDQRGAGRHRPGRQRQRQPREPGRAQPGDRQGPALPVRLQGRADGPAGQALGARVQLERAGQEPVLRRLRHPAVATRLQDGHHRRRLAGQPGDPDQVGPAVHQEPLRQPGGGLEEVAGPLPALVRRGWAHAARLGRLPERHRQARGRAD